MAPISTIWNVVFPHSLSTSKLCEKTQPKKKKKKTWWCGDGGAEFSFSRRPIRDFSCV